MRPLLPEQIGRERSMRKEGGLGQSFAETLTLQMEERGARELRRSSQRGERKARGMCCSVIVETKKFSSIKESVSWVK